jgi:hypothetical protein
MLDPALSGEYGVTIESAHMLLASSCLSIMDRDLRENICHIDQNVPFYGTRSSLELAQQLQDHVHPAVVYAVSSWTFHATECVEDSATQANVRRFFETKLLNLIEACTIGRLISELMGNLHQLQLGIENLENNPSTQDVGTFYSPDQKLMARLERGQRGVVPR